jgi:hypothetical protein
MKRLKNTSVSAITHLGSGVGFPAGEYVTINESDVGQLLDTQMFNWISAGTIVYNDGSSDITDKAAAWSYLKGELGKVAIQTLPEAKPFAEPTHRTKRDATAAVMTCAVDSATTVDYLLTEERYVSGGVMLVKNYEFGDYISAEIHDKDGIIPVPYRPAVAENYPTIAKYVIKEFVEPHNQSGFGRAFIDTRPLSAKVSAGLYLRVTYHSTSTGTAREVVINYHTAKKL